MRTTVADMTDLVLFHPACGLTDGLRAFAATLTGAGHTVHTPDLYDGATFTDLDAGIAHAKGLGFGSLLERGVASAADLPQELVYAGVSLGVMAAQSLAQNRSGARGALLLEACVPPSELGGAWPDGVPVQVHGMDDDPFFAHEGDLDAARALVDGAADRELFVYPGDRHLFADPSLPSYDAAASALLTERVLGFLDRVG